MNLKNGTTLALVVLLAITAGCQKNYLDINNNPNQITAATPSLVLPGALANTGSYMQGSTFDFLNLWMGYWNWSGNYSIPTSDKNYQFTAGFRNGIWDQAYINLENYTYIDTQGATLGQPLVQGMAKIMKALHVQILVDTYGNIPYSQALQGVSVAQPTYDDAKAIYEDLFKQIDAGLALFNEGDKQGSTVVNPAGNDIMFRGNMAKWRRFANTLKLRLLLRLSEKADRAAFIQAQLAIIAASGYGFLKTGENAAVNPGYTNSSGQQSPFYGTYGYKINGQPVEAYNVYRANKYAISFYQSTNDPRLKSYYAPVGGVSGTTYDGAFFGTLNALSTGQTSGIGRGLLRIVSQDAVILSSHEAFFLQAEAAQRGWISGSAKVLYQQAITESFLNVGLTAANAATYYSQPLANVGFDDSPNKLEAIITQKWASLNGWSPFEAWSDYRRLGIPAVPISQDPSTSVKQIPIRLFYPLSEYNYNSTNVQAQGNISQFTSKIFWVK